MSRRPRRNHSAAFKAKVAIEALAEGKTIAEIAHKHDVHPNQVTEWRRQLIERAVGAFERIYQVRYDTRAQARLDIVDWIEGWYNRQRLHSANGFLPPVIWESTRLAA